MRRWIPVLLAAVVGSALLLFLFPRVHPASRWQYRYDRGGFVERARELARAQGIDTAASHVYVGAERRSQLEDYSLHHPEDVLACSLPQQVVKVVLVSPGKRRTFSTELYPNGAVSGWELREEPTDVEARYAPMVDARAVAVETFRKIAAGTADGFRISTDGAGTKRGSRFTWEREEREPGFHPAIDVIIHHGKVMQALTKLQFEDSVERSYANARQGTEWLHLAYFVVIFVMVIGCAVFYTLGGLQRRVDHRFALAFSAVNLCFVVLADLLGPAYGAAHIEEALQGTPAILQLISIGLAWLGVAALGMAVAGGGWFIAGSLRPKWWSLRLLLSRKVFSRPVGASLLAGALWAPLLAAFPAVVSAAFPGALWSHRNAGELVCRSLVMQPLSEPFHPLLLACFGIFFAYLLTRVPRPSIRYPLIALGGLLFFGGYDSQFENMLGADLANAGLLLAATFFLFRSFDLLAVLVAETVRGALQVAAVALLQPSPDLHASAWRLLLFVVALAGVGLLLLLKAPHVEAALVAEGDSITGSMQTTREALKSEFTIAQRAQRQLLPDNAPAVPGYSLAAHCTPAKEVGGDLYDFIPFSRGRLGIAVADVSGKGVPAALYMTLTKGLLAATSQDDLALPALLEQINGHLHRVGRKKTFVTMALAVLDPGDCTLEYARAGHNPAVWRSPSSGLTRLLASQGLGLGITGGRVFGRTLAVETLQLERGDTVVFYSDGLTEAMDPDLEQFGEERLMEVVRQIDHLPAAGARDRILAEVKQFLRGNHPQDDLTLVVLRVE